MGQLAVRLTPRGGRDAIDGWSDGVLHARVAAAPADGAANASLLRLVARTLRVPTSRVRITRGARTRVKHVEVDGLDDAELRRRLDRM